MRPLFWVQGKLVSEQHIRELCGPMINGETSSLIHFSTGLSLNSKLTFWGFRAQIRSPSWPLTFGDLWPLEWWAAPAVLGPQESPEWLVQLDIQVPVDHRATEACQESSEIRVPEVTSISRRLSAVAQERIHFSSNFQL